MFASSVGRLAQVAQGPNSLEIERLLTRQYSGEAKQTNPQCALAPFTHSHLRRPLREHEKRTLPLGSEEESMHRAMGISGSGCSGCPSPWQGDNAS
jgi:hypothetical protein